MCFGIERALPRFSTTAPAVKHSVYLIILYPIFCSLFYKTLCKSCAKYRHWIRTGKPTSVPASMPVQHLLLHLCPSDLPGTAAWLHRSLTRNQKEEVH